MLYSVVDDRSGVCYQEYHCVYGEDVEAALRFLFNAMTAKATDGFPFQGIPEMIYKGQRANSQKSSIPKCDELPGNQTGDAHACW